uniref:HAT C-terminal dimerisation domain-containing protein n=1 Tax=Brassica oleracea var. oleracea TaxID=109376 RepID=A0A0D3DTH3_BRAOL
MDYDTVHTMALLEAQREYMDMNDEDAEFDIDEEMAETETEAEAEVQCEPQATASTQAAKPQRKRRKTSLVWKDFVLVGVEEDRKERAKCIHCDSKLVVGKNHGTKSYSVILAMGAALDPRIKIEMLQAAYKKLDPSTSSLKIKELKDSLSALYKDYQKRSQTSSSGVSLTPTPQEIVTESPLEDDYDNDFFELEKSIGGGVGNPKTHLDIYLEEPRLNRRANLDLDVLSYWKENQHRFGDLASMARDILSIPITTVASESAFSIGSRVLTPYQNHLLPKNVQALLCTRNWLRGFAEYTGAIEDLFDENEDVGKKASNYGVESSASKD